MDPKIARISTKRQTILSLSFVVILQAYRPASSDMFEKNRAAWQMR